ncbi:MAG: phosphatase PAP2 family protein [Acidobacteria bacterium]|nr:phosphatase PAP2 family protein [Acidobacteriota bacterium]
MAVLFAIFLVLSSLTALDTALNESAWITQFNMALLVPVDALRANAPWLTRPMVLLTYLGSDPVLFILVIAVAIRLIQTGQRFDAVWLVSAAVFTRIAGIVLKLAFKSPRPDLITPPPYIHVSLDYGFPSGHALMSTVILGAAAVLAARYLAKRRAAMIVVCCVVMALAIGFSRIYLGVHWPNDVLGGHLYGASILTLACFVRNMHR